MLFRTWVTATFLAATVGCAVDDAPDLITEIDELTAAVVTRSHLEQNVDSLLRLHHGSGCDQEDGRQVCIVTSAVVPPRVLRIGDPIPSVSTLSLCTGGSCAIVTPPPASKQFHCTALGGCLPLAVGCLHGEMHCEPHPSPFPGGGTDLSCTCTVLD